MGLLAEIDNLDLYGQVTYPRLYANPFPNLYTPVADPNTHPTPNLDTQVAYPKSHTRLEVSSLYNWVAEGGGVFVNCALGEPFGLTLLEAAAHGLPVVATKEGGPADIVHVLQNGTLVDPTNPRDIERGVIEARRVKAATRALTACVDRGRQVMLDSERWKACSDNGIDNIHRFTWQAHTQAWHRPASQPLTSTLAT